MRASLRSSLTGGRLAADIDQSMRATTESSPNQSPADGNAAGRMRTTATAGLLDAYLARANERAGEAAPGAGVA